jgi:hypothetical protein
MFFRFPRRYKAGFIYFPFFLLRIHHKEGFSDFANSLPTLLAGCVAFAPIKPPYTQWISKHILGVFKANFMLLLVFCVFGFISNNAALIHYQ